MSVSPKGLFVPSPGDVDGAKHLHREPGDLRHLPLLLHDALDPGGPRHKVLDPRREPGGIFFTPKRMLLGGVKISK